MENQQYCIYLIPEVGVGLIPTYAKELFEAIVANGRCLFTGTYNQCMVYLINPISLN